MSGRTFGAALAVLVLAGTAAAQPANSPAKPNDAQIAHIAYTAGEIDIKAAKQALEKSRNPQIREFAQDMVRDHTAVNDKALALVKKLGVNPQDNDTEPRPQSKQAISGAQQAGQKHEAAPAFDRAYAQNEVAYHQTVNKAHLIIRSFRPPSNPELKSLLETGLKIFQGHEQHAEQVAAGLK